MIELLDLRFTYAGGDRPALDGISLSVPAGQFCAVVGANGAGKSSLCYALTGFIPHFYRGDYRGTASVAGRVVETATPADLAGVAGLVFQDPFGQITGARFTVRDEVAFGLENLGVPQEEMHGRIEQALMVCGLRAVADRSPFALSGGQQQRLAIASILAMRPSLLVLDEPTSQLDPAGTRDLFSALRGLSVAQQTTVLLTEHKLTWVAALADRVVALSGGRVIADGTAREVLTSEAVLRSGVGRTRYTQAASAARQSGLRPLDRPLPVTLAQALEYFR